MKLPGKNIDGIRMDNLQKIFGHSQVLVKEEKNIFRILRSGEWHVLISLRPGRVIFS